MPVTESTIIYTHTDEAPALATYSLLPIVQAYASLAGVDVETRDISLAGRILATFPEHLGDGQRIDDDTLHLPVQDAAGLERVWQATRAAGVVVRALTPVQERFEDVFLRAIAQPQEAAHAAS